ncbi:hypothetical protein [Actinomadura chibensis]|uniref:Uncharacterized protein n=1 Tax=Actinomadura chibensis TaxID=392828 RepID=A0A5D0NCP1_9ACTN|nr:hypothetical protein [Actinomadura chibensis]TYB42059.1 hypothetical protein FXF69_34700 [Actinomadura chibensis]
MRRKGVSGWDTTGPARRCSSAARRRQLRAAEFPADLDAPPVSIADAGDNVDSDAEQRARDRARAARAGSRRRSDRSTAGRSARC